MFELDYVIVIGLAKSQSHKVPFIRSSTILRRDPTHTRTHTHSHTQKQN